MARLSVLFFVVLGYSAFAADHVHFEIPAAPSLALVQSFEADHTKTVAWTGSHAWSAATCSAYLYRPSREDKENTLYDKDNRLECHGTDAEGQAVSLLFALPKVGVQFWGDFRSHHSSTLIGEGVNELGYALNTGRRLKIGGGLIEPFNFCGDGTCLDANDMMTTVPKWNGIDWDYGRTVLSCTQYRTGDKLYRTDCYVIDVTE